MARFVDLRWYAATGVAGLLLAQSAVATNGYSPTGFGTANKGMAGAGVALPQDALAAATNPAGMVFLGDRLDVGLALFSPDRGFTANNVAPSSPPTPSVPPGQYDSDNDLFLIPHFGWNRPLDEASSLGISVGGNGGMNTDYDAAVWEQFYNPSNPNSAPAKAPTGVDLEQLFLGVSYARKINDRHAIGVMPILAVQRFKAKGLQPFQGLSVNPDKVTNNGYDYSWGYGLRVGWLGQLTDKLWVGASAQSRLYMTRFKEYEGLFAEHGDFDVPPTVTVGLRLDATPDVTLVFDWQRIFYGDVKTLGNPNNIALSSPDNFLGADDGLGFGWENINIYKLGVQWQYTPALTLRAGFSYADQLFQGGQALFNVLAPATIRRHASLGLTYALDKRNAISVAYTHAFHEKISGQSVFTGAQTGFVEMDQDELEVSWALRFD